MMTIDNLERTAPRLGPTLTPSSMGGAVPLSSSVAGVSWARVRLTDTSHGSIRLNCSMSETGLA